MKEFETSPQKSASDVVIHDLFVAGEALDQVTDKLRPRVTGVFVRTMVGPAVQRLRKVFQL